MAVSSPLMMAMYLSIGFLYAGFGFLLKGMQIQPYSGVASFVVALLPQLYIARRYIGRARKPTGKSKKLRNWTANTVFSRFLPVIMSCSIVAGLMGASGVAGVQQVAFAKDKTTRMLIRCTVVLIPAMASWRYFKDMLEGETEPLDTDKKDN